MVIHSAGLFSSKMPQNHRIDAMYSCLQACKRWLDLWFSLPQPDVPSITLTYYVQLSHCHVTLYILQTTDEPAWDREIARTTADVLEILQRTIDRLEVMQEVYPFHGGDAEWTVFKKAAKMLRNVKANWEPTVLQGSNKAVSLPNPTVYPQQPTSMATAPMERDGNVMMSGMGPMTGPNMGDPNTAAAFDPTALDFSNMSWMAEGFIPWEF